MRYYNDYNNRYDEPWRARNECYYSGEQSGYYWSRDYYNGPWDFFPKFAELIQSYFIEPMDTEDFQALHEDLTKSDSSLGSLMAVGAEQGNLPASGFYLLLASILSLVIILVGVFKKIRSKGSAVPIPDDKTRKQMVPLWLMHVPLFIFTIFFTILFSISLWPAWDQLDGNNYEDNCIQQAVYLEKFQLFMGDCEFKNRITEGQENLKRDITRALKDSANYSCNAESDTRNWKQLVEKDKDSIIEILDAAGDLLKQLQDLKSLEKEEADLDEVAYTESVINKVVEEVKKLQTILDYAGNSPEVSIVRYKKQKEAYEAKIKELVEPLFTKIEDTATRLKVVKESLNTATKSFASWVTTVGTRFKTIRQELQSNEPLPVIIFMQVIAGFATIVTLVCLAVGFLLFGAGLAYPKDSNVPGYYYCPGLLKFGRRLLTLGFVLMGFFAVALFFISGMALRFSAPSTSVCNSLTDFSENKTGQGFDFYEVMKFTVGLKNFEGKTIRLNFGELMGGNSRNGLANKDGNLFEDLIPSMRAFFDIDGFAKQIEKIDLPKLDSVTIPDQNKALRPFKRALLALEDIDLSKLTAKKQLANLVNKEIKTFKRLIQETPFVSFNVFVISGCSNGFAEHLSPMNKLRTAMGNNFEEYRGKLMYNLYESHKFNDVYRSATSGFCLRIRLPASGVWLASMLLGTIILVSMIVVFKVSNRLCIHDEDVFTMDNESVTTISTITAPLIDAKMTEKDVQVYDI